MNVPPMQDGCPWSGLSHLATPNVKWCEAQQCGWIVEPANTWSNLAYLALGAGLLLAARDRRLARMFGWAQLAVGLFSFAYHMSFTFVLQVLDFAGMYVFTGLLLVLNLWRLGAVPAARLRRVYPILVAGLTLVTVPLGLAHFPIQALVAGLVLAILGTELALRRESVERRYFFVSLALLAAAATASALDVTRVLCDPKDHVLQGHAVWHVLSALSLLASWRFYSQFEGRLVLVPEGQDIG